MTTLTAKENKVKELKKDDYFYVTPESWGDPQVYLLSNSDNVAKTFIAELTECGIHASLDDLVTVHVIDIAEDEDGEIEITLLDDNKDETTISSFDELNFDLGDN